MGRMKGPLTSSGETGLWLVFLSSSMILGSRRRSFLQPTRMMGRFWQKCKTSEIHCRHQHEQRTISNYVLLTVKEHPRTFS